MLKIRLDHVAIGLPRKADAEPFLEGTLGGVKAGDFAESPPFGFTQWVFTGGGLIEVIFPIGDDGFVHRFLAKGGPRIHHVTFKAVFARRDARARRSARLRDRFSGSQRSALARGVWGRRSIHGETVRFGSA